MNENNNMRIAYVLHSTDPLAGATKAFLFLLKGLMAKGIIPFVIVPDKRGIYSTLEDMGVVVLVLNYRPEAWTYQQTAKDFLLFLPRMVARLYVNWLSSIRLTAWLKDKNISLVHTNVGVISIGFRAARRLNIPHIYHIREYGDKDFNIRYFPNKHAFWYQFKAPKSYSICITRDIQAYHKQDGNQHSQVIYDGVMPAVAVCPHIDKENYLLYAGRIEQAKGLDILLEAYSDYVEKSSTIIPLWIAGSMNNSQYLDKIKSIVSNRKLSQHITFLGERNDLQSLMQRAKAIIIPSRFEGFGFCMAEAMFNGCLAIGNNTAGTREQFDNGLQLEKKEIGIRYNTKEELTQRLIDITNSPAVHYKDMVARAFHTVNSMYSREKHTENVYVFYKRIIKESI